MNTCKTCGYPLILPSNKNRRMAEDDLESKSK